MFDTIFSDISLGLSTALSVDNVLYCLLGVTLGTLLGMIPGIGTLAALSLLYPVTLYLDPLSAIIMLAGIYYGTAYGGSISSILLNLPGTPQNAIAVLDGYPMSKQGRAGVALFITAYGSFIGASIGIVIMMVFAPVIAEYALQVAEPEYFAMMLLGLIAASTVSPGLPLKGFAMALLGVALGIVGTDKYSGIYRFTFGIPELYDGLSLVALAMGLFGVSEVINSIRDSRDRKVDANSITLRSMIPSWHEFRISQLPILRGSAFGAFFGALPGTGGLIAAFMSYVVEKKLAKDPSRFGKGAIEGVAGPEAANNAADQTAFIPTMTLGIPGTASMAIMLGLLMIHGISPGPRMIADRPDMFWGLIMSFWIGNIMLVVLNIPLIGVWVRILAIPYQYLYPAILAFVGVGVLSVNAFAWDVWVTIGFAVLGYLILLLEFPPAPLILGFILGPLVEVNFRRAMVLSDGNPATFFSSPFSAIVMTINAGLMAWAIWASIRPLLRRQDPVAVEQAE